MSKNRIAYIDIAKGIAVLLVIFGHTFRDSMRADHFWCDYSYFFVYRFHVSTLFILSGMSYRIARQKYLSQNPLKYIIKKSRQLLLPWFSYSVLIYAVFSLVQFVPAIKDILSGGAYGFVPPLSYLRSMLMNENPYSFHLWYLNALFLMTVFTYLIDRFFNKTAARTLEIVFIMVVPVLYTLFGENQVWVIKGFLQKLPLFLLGTLLDYDVVIRRAKALSIIGVISAAVLAVYTYLFNFEISVTSDSCLTGILLFFAENAIAAMTALGISAICHLLREKLKFVEYLGRNSMIYYLYHQPFCCAFLGMALYDVIKLPAIVVVIACSALSIIIPYLVVKTVKRLKLTEVFQFFGLPV